MRRRPAVATARCSARAGPPTPPSTNWAGSNRPAPIAARRPAGRARGAGSGWCPGSEHDRDPEAGQPQGHAVEGLPGRPSGPCRSRLLARLSRECSAAGGALTKASTWTTALSQHCLCGRRAKKPLAQRWHSCPCGIEGDRDIVSAILAATVRLADPGDPKTASIDHGLREHARRLLLTGHVLATDTAAQQEGPARSTVHHNPATGTGEDGSHPVVASAGQGERPAQPRHRPHGHPWGRRRNGRISSTPPIRKLELRINS
jgi:hypothetical protein